VLHCVTLVVFVAAVAGCARASGSAARPPAAPAPQTENAEPPEPTLRSAGADTCRVGSSVSIGELADANATFGVTFGTAGGLVVWASAQGPRTRPLSVDGMPNGPERALDTDEEASPFEPLPYGAGFAMVEWRLIHRSDCRTSLCPPHGMWASAVLTDLDGRPQATSTRRFLGLAPLAGVTSASDGSFAFATSEGQVVLVGTPKELREPSLRIVAELATAGYLLPVRGAGAPALLVAGDSGDLFLADAGGGRHVAGEPVGPNGTLLTVHPQARWGRDGWIHLAWQLSPESPTLLGYGVIVPGPTPTFRRVGGPGDVDREGWREPFDSYVVADPEASGRVVRYDALHRRVGQPVDLSAIDPEVRPERMHVGWNGTSFVVVYAALRGPGAALREVVLRCR
jgi:hypothetical protein